MNDNNLSFYRIPTLDEVNKEEVQNEMKKRIGVFFLPTVYGSFKAHRDHLIKCLYDDKKITITYIRGEPEEFNDFINKLEEKKDEDIHENFLDLRTDKKKLDRMEAKLRQISEYYHDNIKGIAASTNFYFHAFGHTHERSAYNFDYYLVLPNTEPVNSWLLQEFEKAVGSNDCSKKPKNFKKCEEFWGKRVLSLLDKIAYEEYNSGHVPSPRRKFLLERLGRFLPFLEDNKSPWIFSEPFKFDSVVKLDRWEKILLFEGFLAPEESENFFKTLYIPHPFLAYKVASSLTVPIKCKHAENYDDFLKNYNLDKYQN